jgi:hypothetical protein
MPCRGAVVTPALADIEAASKHAELRTAAVRRALPTTELDDRNRPKAVTPSEAIEVPPRGVPQSHRLEPAAGGGDVYGRGVAGLRRDR